MRNLFVLLGLMLGLKMAAEVPAPPRLVVVVMVDELGSEQLFLWQKKFEKGGLSRLINQGTFYPYVSVNSTSLYEGTSVASFFRVVVVMVDAYRDWETDRKSTRLNSSHITRSRMPSSA